MFIGGGFSVSGPRSLNLRCSGDAAARCVLFFGFGRLHAPPALLLRPQEEKCRCDELSLVAIFPSLERRLSANKWSVRWS